MTFFKKQQDAHKARQLRVALEGIAKSHDGKVLCELLLEPSLREADKGIRNGDHTDPSHPILMGGARTMAEFLRMLTEARGE